VVRAQILHRNPTLGLLQRNGDQVKNEKPAFLQVLRIRPDGADPSNGVPWALRRKTLL